MTKTITKTNVTRRRAHCCSFGFTKTSQNATTTTTTTRSQRSTEVAGQVAAHPTPILAHGYRQPVQYSTRVFWEGKLLGINLGIHFQDQQIKGPERNTRGELGLIPHGRKGGTKGMGGGGGVGACRGRCKPTKKMLYDPVFSVQNSCKKDTNPHARAPALCARKRKFGAKIGCGVWGGAAVGYECGIFDLRGGRGKRGGGGGGQQSTMRVFLRLGKKTFAVPYPSNRHESISYSKPRKDQPLAPTTHPNSFAIQVTLGSGVGGKGGGGGVWGRGERVYRATVTSTLVQCVRSQTGKPRAKSSSAAIICPARTRQKRKQTGRKS